MSDAAKIRDRRSSTRVDCASVWFETLIVGLNRIVHREVHDCQVELRRWTGAELNTRPSGGNDRLGTDVPVVDHVGRSRRGNR